MGLQIETATNRSSRLEFVVQSILILASSFLLLARFGWLSFLFVSPTNPPPASLPNGVAAGDVTQESAVLWARSTITGVVTFMVGVGEVDSTSAITRTVVETAIPVTATLSGLKPGTAYAYQVVTATGDTVDGQFRTAAAVGAHPGLRFGVSADATGDLGPYPSISNAPGRLLDFFVLLGDSIYADFSSPAVAGQARTLPEFRRKYAEVYATQNGINNWANLRAATALFAIFDDHEVLNDFAGGAPAASTRYFAETTGLVNQTKLYLNGTRAFSEYHPIAREVYGSASGSMQERQKFYRYRTFGSDAAIFLLDTRSFRDGPLDKPDVTDAEDVARFLEESFRPDRTLLGLPQLDNFLRDLQEAQELGITWKIVFLPDPIQELDMVSAQDRYQGYAAERTQILRFIAEQGIENVVFVSADIHGALVNNLTYQEGVGQPHIPVSAFEVTTGPIAFHAPYGLTKIWTAQDYGLMIDDDVDRYFSLSIHNDSGGEVDDRDDFIKAYLDEQLALLGNDPIGLEGSPISAELLQGDYIAAHTYGWTEFEVDRDSQTLTITTYGIPPYTADDVATRSRAVITRRPTIASKFVVQPAGLDISDAEWHALSLTENHLH